MRFLHIRTGAAKAARVIDQWIERHALAGRVVDDPYHACALLIRAPQAIPELLFVGLDRLADDELQIVSLARETWPATLIISYGEPRPLLCATGLRRHCDDAIAVERLLQAAGPAELIRVEPLKRSAAAVERTALHLPDIAALPQAAQSELPPPRAAAPRSQVSSPAPGGGLSPREIAALLGEGHG